MVTLLSNLHTMKIRVADESARPCRLRHTLALPKDSVMGCVLRMRSSMLAGEFDVPPRSWSLA
jgi:hypothetical protein